MTDMTPYTEHTTPVLYSFRRCPYAIRARLAIAIASTAVELREIELKHKPEEMLLASPKGTVPVLRLGCDSILDESLDIMLWALHQNDPEHWLNSVRLEEARQLIRWNDTDFKPVLDRYKYADRHPELPKHSYRQQGELFLTELERRLNENQYLCGPHFALADAAILPFVRQFAAVDAGWFRNAPYPAVRQWLDHFLKSRLFASTMARYQSWKPGDPGILFGITSGNHSR